ncbi:hypothetical protein [Nocardia wallacei]|uniref:hypothetical protein n=1 Tax=Nocardia wallacei TaxID=480035 RepID=UPI0024575682|nr:hypothetical protein [Nocardia wallacei]
MDGELTTEVDGLEAVWRPTHDTSKGIEVMAVHDTGEHPVVEVVFAPGTDLAEARQRCPRWNRLWDKVRHEFWTEVAGPPARSAASGRWAR